MLAKPHRPAYARLPLLLPIVLILVVAAALRLIWLDLYPIGWHHDEALMGVMAGEVYRGESRPIFFQQYLGQEPLYIYLAAGAMALLGGDEGVLPLRLTSAVVGLVTVGLTYALGRTLFGPRVGLLAMALIGASFWQVMSSRMAYRSITQPLLEALAVILLWQARRRGGLGWYALTGAALGSVLYTYLGARAFPGVFVAFGLWLLVTQGRPKREDIRRVTVLALACLIVLAPLGLFFLSHPGAFSARMQQVFVFRPEVNGGNPWPLVADSAGKLLRTFTIAGEPMWRYNIPGRPIFVGVLGLAFYGGLAILVRRALRRDDAAVFVLIWLAVMLFPGLLSWESGAYTLRAMGTVPALYLVPALALDWLWRAGGRRAGERPAGQRQVTSDDQLAGSGGPLRALPLVAPALIAAVLLIETAWTARDYFAVWAPSFGASAEGHADSVAQARFLVREAQPDREDIFVASEYYHHPVLAQLARPVYSALRWFDGRQSVTFSPGSERPALYVLAFNGMPPEIGRLFPESGLIGAEPFAEGVDGDLPPPLFLAYRLTPEQIQTQVRQLLEDPAARPVTGRLPGVIEPLRAQLAGPAPAGSTLPVTLVWRIEGAPPPGDYQMLAHLLDHRLQKVSGVDALGYPVAEWRPGDVVWSRFEVPLPAELAPGRYQVQIALYNLNTGERLPVEGGVPGSQAFDLGSVRVVGSGPIGAPARSIGARLGDDLAIELIGLDQPVQAADAVTVTLHWRAEQPPPDDYTAFVQLQNAAGQLVAQSDSWPAQGALPTSAWLPNEIVRDEHRLDLGGDLPPGTYRLIAGLYHLPSGRRLPVASGGDFVELATLTLR